MLPYMSPTKRIIIGLDPGTVKTGFAIIHLEDDQSQLQDMGVLEAPASHSLTQRICAIGENLKKLYQKYVPQETAIEQVFLGKNVDSAFKLGQIFGVCVYHATYFDSQLSSYASRFVKKSVTGSGHASKQMVNSFVSNIFNLQDKNIKIDATDALAVALCHIQQTQNN